MTLREVQRMSNVEETTDLGREIHATARKRHDDAKKKKFADFQKNASEVKKRGIRFYDKKGSGYIKAGKKKYD